MSSLNIGQVRWIFDGYINGMPPGTMEKIKRDCIDDLAGKNKKFKGQAYIDQLEKNSVYLAELSAAIQLLIARYLYSGEPRLHPNNISGYMNEARTESVNYSQAITLLILNFIRGITTDFDRGKQFSHQNWDKLKVSRLAGDLTKYREELEYSYVFYQASYVLSQNFLFAFLHDPELAGCATALTRQEMIETIQQRVDIWTSMCLSNIQSDINYQQATSKSDSKKGWKFWK